MNRKQTRLVSLLSLFLAATAGAPALRAEVVNKIVLRVNDRIATLRDYQERRDSLASEILRRENDPQERQRLLAQAGEVTFANMFRDLLMESRADQLGVVISEARVDAAVAELKQNFNITNDQEFVAALAQSGMTLEQLRAQLRSQIRVQEARGQDVQSRVQLDEEDLRRFYRKNLEQFRQPEQLQLREVVVLEEGGAPADERGRIAAEIRAKVAAGTPLADAVAELSQRGVTSNVIELGWISPGDLDRDLETAVWSLPKGSVSEPVQARGGLHLVQVLDRRESRIPPFSEVAGLIEQRERERVFREEISKYMTELEQKALIVANPPAEAANFRRRIAADPLEEGLEVPQETPGGAPAVAPPTGDLPASPATTPVPGQPGGLPTPKPVDPSPAEVPPPSPPPPGL